MEVLTFRSPVWRAFVALVLVVGSVAACCDAAAVTGGQPSSSLDRPAENAVLSSPGLVGVGMRADGPGFRHGASRLRGADDPTRALARCLVFRTHGGSRVVVARGRHLSRSNPLVPLHRRVNRSGSHPSSDDPDSASHRL